MAVSVGRRNAERELQLPHTQEPKSLANLKSTGTLPRLGSDCPRAPLHYRTPENGSGCEPNREALSHRCKPEQRANLRYYPSRRPTGGRTDHNPRHVDRARVLQTARQIFGRWTLFAICVIQSRSNARGWLIYDESWASFRGGHWRCDFWLGGDGDSGGSRNSSRRVRAEHAALRQDRRRPAALARRAAQTGIRAHRRAHEETECVFHPLYQARPGF